MEIIIVAVVTYILGVLTGLLISRIHKRNIYMMDDHWVDRSRNNEA